MASGNTAETAREQARYDVAARHYDAFVWPMEAMAFGRLRKRLWRDLEAARLLEIGVGTGANIPLYPPGSRIVAVDLSPAMLRRAVARAARSGRAIDFLLADAEHLPFRDGAFDVAVSTCVFCSVPDPIAGLREAARVLRAGSRMLLLEHVRARNRALGKVMDWLNPLAVRTGGESINRDTVANVKAGGFAIESEESSLMGIVKLLGARPRDGAG